MTQRASMAMGGTHDCHARVRPALRDFTIAEFCQSNATAHCLQSGQPRCQRQAAVFIPVCFPTYSGPDRRHTSTGPRVVVERLPKVLDKGNHSRVHGCPMLATALVHRISEWLV